MGKQVSVDIVAQFHAHIALRCAGPWFDSQHEHLLFSSDIFLC